MFLTERPFVHPSTESGSSITIEKLDLIQCMLNPFFCAPQAEFSEINLASYVNSGCMVDMQVNKGGTKVVR